MKKIGLAIVFLTCKISLAQSFELLNNSDTINYVDEQGLKQKHWVYKGKDKKLQDYEPEQKVEEGDYADSRKTGVWRMYYANDQLKHELTFQNNRPYGYAKFYYKNGNVSEEGFWKINKWEGEYKLYYENGQVQYEWNYKNGKREGEQKYYHPNGQLHIKGEWNGGKESGVQEVYDPEGNLIEKRVYNDGKIDAEKSEVLTPKDEVTETQDLVPQDKIEEQPADAGEPKPDKPKGPITRFKGNGYHKLYDPNSKQLKKDGLFKNGDLIDGWVFLYETDLDDKCHTKIELKNRRKIKEDECKDGDGGRKED